MRMFAQMLLYALLAITAENMILAGGVGVSRVLRAARKPKIMRINVLLVGLFTMISTLLGILLNGVLPTIKTFALYRPLVFAVCTAVVYLVFALICRTWWPKRYKRLEPTLSSSAINCVVLSMPFAQQALRMEPWQAVGYGLGTALAYFLAVMILSTVMSKIWNPEMPKAFQGLPAIFIYVGILSMALFGFIGGRVF